MGAYVRAWFSSRVFDSSGVCTGFYLLFAMNLSRWIGFCPFVFSLFVSCDRVKSLIWISVFFLFFFCVLRSNSIAGLDFRFGVCFLFSCLAIKFSRWIGFRYFFLSFRVLRSNPVAELDFRFFFFALLDQIKSLDWTFFQFPFSLFVSCD